MPKRLATGEFIEKARLVHGDKYDYSKVKYETTKTKVCIICPKHGEFWQTPERHLQGRGCQRCSKSFKDNLQDFVVKAKRTHECKYDYSKVEYKSSQVKVCIKCPKHGDFWQEPASHLQGHGCPLCALERENDILGVGKYDVLSSSRTQSVRIWKAMIARCYSDSFLKERPTYSDCSICAEWLTFSNFKKWFDEHYVDGWCLDKDILVKGNREYAPDKCCFVPNEINVLFHKEKKNNRGLPKGVTKLHKRYRATFRSKMVGSFYSVDEATESYINAKKKWIITLADKYKEKLNMETYNALYNYKVGIDD